MTTVNNNTQTNTGSVTTPTQPPPSVAAGSPSTGTKLYVDQYNVIVDQQNLEKLTKTQGADWHDITKWQDQYDKDLNTYKADLTADQKSSVSSWTQANLDAGPVFNDQDNVVSNPKPDDLSPGIGTGAHDAWDWDSKELAHLTTTYKTPLFADQGTTAGLEPRVDGRNFPGGQQGDAFEGKNLTQGYISPPAVGASSNLADVYKNLTPDQAAYTGWALAQAAQGKQLYVPPEDAQSWNLITTYAAANNAYIKEHAGNPDDGDTGVDAQVAASYQGNTPQNIGAVIGEAIGGVVGTLLGVALPGLSEIGIFGEAGTEASAAAGVAGVGGEAGSATEAATETAAAAATTADGTETAGNTGATGLSLGQRLDAQGKPIANGATGTTTGGTGGSTTQAAGKLDLTSDFSKQLQALGDKLSKSDLDAADADADAGDLIPAYRSPQQAYMDEVAAYQSNQVYSVYPVMVQRAPTIYPANGDTEAEIVPATGNVTLPNQSFVNVQDAPSDAVNAGKNDYRAARALEKHGGDGDSGAAGRQGTYFPPARGTEQQREAQGIAQVNSIVNDPRAQVTVRYNFPGTQDYARYGALSYDIRLPNATGQAGKGAGVRFSSSAGNFPQSPTDVPAASPGFVGFLEPSP